MILRRRAAPGTAVAEAPAAAPGAGHRRPRARHGLLGSCSIPPRGCLRPKPGGSLISASACGTTQLVSTSTRRLTPQRGPTPQGSTTLRVLQAGATWCARRLTPVGARLILIRPRRHAINFPWLREREPAG